MLIRLNTQKMYFLEIYAVMLEVTAFFDNFSSGLLFLLLSVESITAPEIMFEYGESGNFRGYVRSRSLGTPVDGRDSAESVRAR